MSHDLVKFRLPADFIVERAWLLPDELAYGFSAGWIDSRTLVRIVEVELNRGATLPSALERVGMLLSDEYVAVPELVSLIGGRDDQQSARVWLYLALAWLFDHRADFDAPLEIVEMLYADFGYPREIEGLVRFQPGRRGDRTGPDALIARWASYLTRRAAEYAERARDI